MKNIYLSDDHVSNTLSPQPDTCRGFSFRPPPSPYPQRATTIINLGEHNVTLYPDTASAVQLIRNAREYRDHDWAEDRVFEDKGNVGKSYKNWERGRQLLESTGYFVPLVLEFEDLVSFCRSPVLWNL